MKTSHEQMKERLAPARDAYMHASRMQPGEEWVAQVMHSVHAEPLRDVLQFPRQEKVVWRAAAAAALLGLLAGAATVRFPAPDNDMSWRLATGGYQYEWLLAMKE